MSGHGTHTHWGMVINNYDDNDLALVANAYPDHIRKLTYTKEVGEGGTPHIQAALKMKRDCRLSHMKKLFPRANFKYLDTLEYKLNAELYAQKQDKTADGPSVIINGDPLHTIEGIIRTIALAMVAWYADDNEDSIEWETVRSICERDAVKKDYTMAKVFVSATYKSMWKDFGHEMFQNISHTHTHTHTQFVDVPTPLKEYRDVEVQTDASLQDPDSEGDDADQGSSAGDGTEGDYESDGDEGSEGTDCEGIGE